MALSCLEGEARTWSRGFGYLLANYGKFQQYFREQYWGQRAQRLVRDELMHGAYDFRSGLKMTEYFLTLVTKARYLDQAPPERDLVIQLSKHFPRNVSYLLHTCVDIASAHSLLQTEDQYSGGRSVMQNRPLQNTWRNRSDEQSNSPRYNSAASNSNNGRQNTREVRTAIVDFGEEEVEVQIGNVTVLGLIDTGSEINCISQHLFDQLIAAGVEVEEFPVTKTSVRGAVGKKSSKISAQIYVTVQIQTLSFDLVLVIVKDLYCDLILGEMFLHETGAHIRHQTKDILLRSETRRS
nr:uncharacterized protein LOC115258914 [Aedes albopictus]